MSDSIPDDGDRLLGEPIDSVPVVEPDDHCNARRSEKVDGENVFTGYCQQPAGSRTEHSGEGRCWLHGGATPRGEDSPHFKHGLFADYLDDESREVIDVLEEYEDGERLDTMIRWRMARIRRAVKHMSDAEDAERSFWDAFEELATAAAESGDGIESEDIRELANMLSSGQRALQDEIDLVRRLILAHSKITEGEKLNVEQDTTLRGAADFSVEWTQTGREESAVVDED